MASSLSRDILGFVSALDPLLTEMHNNTPSTSVVSLVAQFVYVYHVYGKWTVDLRMTLFLSI